MVHRQPLTIGAFLALRRVFMWYRPYWPSVSSLVEDFDIDFERWGNAGERCENGGTQARKVRLGSHLPSMFAQVIDHGGR